MKLNIREMSRFFLDQEKDKDNIRLGLREEKS